MLPEPERQTVTPKPVPLAVGSAGARWFRRAIGSLLAGREGSTAFNLLLDRYAELEVVHRDGVTLLATGSVLGAELLPVSVTRA